MSKKKKNSNYILYILGLVTLGLAYITWQKGGIDLILQGLQGGGSLLLKEIPLLVAAFLTAGLLQALVKKEAIERWLGSESGWRGLALACVGGALIPGGPYAYYPIAGALLSSGAGIGVLIAFVTAKNLWSVSRLPMEFALLGTEVTLIRYAITFLFPPLLGFLAENFFGNHLERIREAMKQ
ncbi:MAG: hypothetical protein MAG431_01319 [Chloroflexi bacterium]|nr:hypothetical protein [Chloroflexota bacterium]